jgi:hypothetical protein
VWCSTLPLTTADIALLYDDFSLGRSIVPPHAACVRPALIRWDPRAPLSLENCVVAEMKEDALGELIDSALLPQGFVPSSPEELWGVDATRIAQARIAQAQRFREWALH